MSQEEEKGLFSTKNIGIALLIILITPIPITLIISWGNWLNFVDGTSTVWIGFWGSYLGGIIGTAGVVYVAQIQNKQQRELNKQQSIEQRELNEKMLSEQREISRNQMADEADRLEKLEKYNKERLKIQQQLTMIEDYSRKVEQFKKDVDFLQEGANSIVLSYLLSENLSKTKLESFKTLDFEANSFWKGIVSFESSHFFKSFDRIIQQQMLLDISGITFTKADIDSMDFKDNISELDEAVKFLTHNKLFMKEFIETKMTKKSESEYVLKIYDEVIQWAYQEETSVQLCIIQLIKNLE